MRGPRAALATVLAAALAMIATSAQGADPLPPRELYSPRTWIEWLNQRPQVLRDECVAGQCFIQLQPGVTIGQLREMLAEQGGQLLRAFPRYGLFLVSLPPGLSVREGVVRWRAQRGIRHAGPNRILRALLTPNDPLYSQQYHWPLVQAPAGWDMQTGSALETVAVLDTGQWLTHEDFAGRLWVNADEVPGNGQDDDQNGFVDDINGWDFVGDDPDVSPHPTQGQHAASHGTHCAGLIGAATNNNIGVAGHDWACKIMVCRVMNEDGTGTEDALIAGMDYAIDNGARVMSLSLGFASYAPELDPVLERARQQGVLVVAAAGNEDWQFTDDPNTWMSPVCNDGPNPTTDNWVLGVAATDRQDKKASFSNYDGSSTKTFVDVCAPGVGIWSCVIYDPANGFDNSYEPWDGTSMATPIVAGLAALVRAAHPQFGPLQILNQIKAGCDNIDGLNPGYAGKLGAGRINTARAIGVDLPPGPPRAVMAGDTPNDDQGNVTVSWSKSVDDGGGMNDVKDYVVYRCDNEQDASGRDVPKGNWTVRKVVPVGEPLVYIDNVGEGRKFWYQVSARDAVNETMSRPAGPAEARDDIPPPAVQSLVAADTQGDDGGRISLTWSYPDPPADLAGFRIYRSESQFNRISPALRIADLPQQPGQPLTTFYQDVRTPEHEVKDGVRYWYAVTAYDDAGNEVQQVEAVSAQAAPNLMLTLPAGLSLMAIGAQTYETDMAALLLGSDHRHDPSLRLTRWEPLEERWHHYRDNPTDPLLEQQPGRGFWVYLDKGLLLNIEGQPITAENWSVPVLPGWNLLGNPFGQDLRWDPQAIKLRAGGTEYTLAESNQRGITRDFAWIYDPYAASYRLVAAGVGQPYVRRGYGFWFLALQSGELVLPRPASVATATQPGQPQRPVDWKLQLVARCGSCVDTDNYLGVSPQAAELNQVVSPPAVGPSVELYFVNGRSGERAALSFVTPTQPKRWEVRVTTSGLAGREVELTWPDLSKLPGEIRPLLIDRLTGRQLYMRTTTSYRFRAPAGTGERVLEVVLAEGTGRLQVSGLAARPGQRGAEIVFSLSTPAQVEVEIMNLAGRRVRHLTEGQQLSAGGCTVRWNGLSDKGSPVPAGQYLVRVRARSADGQESSAVALLRLGR
jgi:hypothetical protein